MLLNLTRVALMESRSSGTVFCINIENWKNLPEFPKNALHNYSHHYSISHLLLIPFSQPWWIELQE